MRRLGQYVASAVISISLVASSTAAVAQTESAPVAPATNGWMQLSMLTPSSAAVLDSSAVAAAQPNGPAPGYYAGPGAPPIPVIILWLALIGVFIYIVTKGNSSQKPNSPF